MRERAYMLRKKEMQDWNRILDRIIKRILMLPITTPREIIYMETGLLDIENTIKKNRINFLNKMEKKKGLNSKEKY